MVGESNQNVFSIQKDASSFAEFELSEFEISRFDCTMLVIVSYRYKDAFFMFYGQGNGKFREKFQTLANFKIHVSFHVFYR